MWNGNAVAVGGFLLATTLVPLAGCDIGAAPRNKAAYESRQFELPNVRYRIDPERSRVWLLAREGVFVYDLSRPERVPVPLPGWLTVDAPYSCPPDLALGPKGEALITSNTVPTLWRIDPESLAVTVHPLLLDADTNKDVGFSALAYSAQHGAFIAASYAHGSLWRIDPRLERAQKILALRAITGSVRRRRAAAQLADGARPAGRPVRARAGRRLVRHPRAGLALRPRERRAVHGTAVAFQRRAAERSHRRELAMRYQLTPILCRPWLLNGLSLKLIESHYENNYGGALRRLNAITEQLESLDFAKTPGHVLNGLKREELVALNSTLLHELYFASLGGEGKPTRRWPTRSRATSAPCDRWRSEFVAMGNALGGGSGWVLLVYVPRDRRLVNQYAPSTARPSPAASRSSRSTCTSTPTTSTSARTRRPTWTRSCATSTGRRSRSATRMR